MTTPVCVPAVEQTGALHAWLPFDTMRHRKSPRGRCFLQKGLRSGITEGWRIPAAHLGRNAW
ncbi:MAG: hypothetical protein QHI48_07655 [Bacteroidota bacterium]|nr:hypothetical protein [Bacteroidota bacterium]